MGIRDNGPLLRLTSSCSSSFEAFGLFEKTPEFILKWGRQRAQRNKYLGILVGTSWKHSESCGRFHGENLRRPETKTKTAGSAMPGPQAARAQ